MKKFSLMLVLLTSLLITACDDDDDDDSDPVTSNDIVAVAQNNNELSTLVDALSQAGLVSTLQGDGPFTVFAPNNAAFDSLLAQNGWASLSEIPAETLEAVLKYHVVSGEVKSTDLAEGYVATLSEGPNGSGVVLSVTNDGGFKFNEASPVEVDVEASNGVVHVIDKVMMPTNMVDIATANPNLSTLVEALSVTGLTTDFLAALADSDNYTVFAPTNDAFVALLGTNTDWNGLDDIPVSLLNDVLSYHIVSGNVRSGDLQAGSEPTLLAGVDLTINLDNGAAVETINGQSVPVAIADIQATNGVYHVIEEVLLPIEAD